MERLPLWVAWDSSFWASEGLVGAARLSLALKTGQIFNGGEELLDDGLRAGKMLQQHWPKNVVRGLGW